MGGYKYEYIHITNIYDRSMNHMSKDIDDYMVYLKQNPNMVERIGEYTQQVKPVFDIDAYNTDIDVDSVKNNIN